MNNLFANMVSNNMKENYFASCTFLMCTVGTFVFLDFKFDDMKEETIKALVLFCVFACFLAPFYVYLSKAILNETMEEAKLLYIERDSFRQLFDAL